MQNYYYYYFFHRTSYCSVLNLADKYRTRIILSFFPFILVTQYNDLKRGKYDKYFVGDKTYKRHL